MTLNVRKWVIKTERPDMKMNKLEDSDGYPSLDAKLAAALPNILTGDLSHQAILLKEKRAIQNKT